MIYWQWAVVAAAGGYVACVFTWPKVKVWINGAQTEARKLEDKAKALRASL